MSKARWGGLPTRTFYPCQIDTWYPHDVIVHDKCPWACEILNAMLLFLTVFLELLLLERTQTWKERKGLKGNRFRHESENGLGYSICFSPFLTLPHLFLFVQIFFSLVWQTCLWPFPSFQAKFRNTEPQACKLTFRPLCIENEQTLWGKWREELKAMLIERGVV